MSDEPTKKSADGVWTQTRLGTARPMTREAMIEAFGPHPDADWKYVPSKTWPRKKRKKPYNPHATK